MIPNQAFISYFEKTFFPDPIERDAFLASLTQSLRRSIRVNTRLITPEKLRQRLESQGWKLTPTETPTLFLIERGDDFSGIDERLGFSLEHLLGLFYIQERSAASSVEVLTGGKVNHEPLLILDLAASPGGKTTQLAEAFPSSFIVANDASNDRIAQLISNVERMRCDNIGITHYPGTYFGRFAECFDRIILDAPCSGEGIGFKATESLRYWNLKKVKSIADVQFRLLESALRCLKVGGEIVYSTCTMNRLENEEVLEKMEKKYPGTFEIITERRFWPHRDHTGWFFHAHLRKISPLPYPEKTTPPITNRNIHPIGTSEESMIHAFLKLSGYSLEERKNISLKNESCETRKNDKIFMKSEHQSDLYEEVQWARSGALSENIEVIPCLHNRKLFVHDRDILAVAPDAPFLRAQELFYFLRLGQHFGKFEGNTFVPDWHLGLEPMPTLPHYEIGDEMELDRYLHGEDIPTTSKDPFTHITYKKEPIGIGSYFAATKTIRNGMPKQWRRR